MDDELLVVQAQLGERAAFAELVGLPRLADPGLFVPWLFWATEPGPLSDRTHLSFALLVLICLAWTAYGIWSTTRRTPLFALNLAAWLALAALLTTTVTLTLAIVRDEGVPLALATGAVLTIAGALLVTRAHTRRTSLLRRKADLTR